MVMGSEFLFFLLSSFLDVHTLSFCKLKKLESCEILELEKSVINLLDLGIKLNIKKYSDPNFLVCIRRIMDENLFFWQFTGILISGFVSIEDLFIALHNVIAISGAFKFDPLVFLY